jgi:hypothetical protein
MFAGNSSQPGIRPQDIAFVAAREKKRGRPAVGPVDDVPASLDPKGGDGGGEGQGDGDNGNESTYSDSEASDEVKLNDSVASLNSMEMYKGILNGDTPTAGMPKGRGGEDEVDVDRILRHHASSYFLPDARWCFLFVWTITAFGIGILAAGIATTNKQATFSAEVRNVRRHG